jgi:hypothetical protein
MSKFNDLLNLRFRSKPTQPPKMSALVERSANGELSSFSGVFRVTALSESEKSELETILTSFRVSDEQAIDADLKALAGITSEVKAITNQAVILHGERIKRAQDILKKYRDGAFTAWLFTTYGNRQTPYNFLQYYEFYTTMPEALHVKIDQMPRQAVYSLASRQGSIEKKEAIVRNYNGQAKQELLQLIRIEFPLAEEDKRHPNYAAHAIAFMKRAREMMKNSLCVPSEEEKKQLKTLLTQVTTLLEKR